MKKTKRFFLGLLSSVLFAAGFIRSANLFDPLNSSHSAVVPGEPVTGALDTGGSCIACWMIDNGS